MPPITICLSVRVFFFSSRRRHTRCSRDWSSDVCSSDLIAILPAMGLCSQLLSVFSRKPIFGYRAMVYAILAIGFLGFMVWGHHMFMSGMSPYTAFAFSIMTMGIGVPSAIKTFNWLGTLWGGKIRFSSPMLFAIGFVSLFVVGGISGPFLAQPVLDIYLHETY